MSIPPKEPKFRVSFSKNDLELFKSYLSKDLENILENAPLLADIQKMIRKIEFQVSAPYYESKPKALSHAFERIAEKAVEENSEALFKRYEIEGASNLSEADILLAILYKSEKGMELSKLEQEVLNADMMKKLGSI